MSVIVAADEAEYTLTYGERGSRVVLVASEPITRSAGHWVRRGALAVHSGTLQLQSALLGICNCSKGHADVAHFRLGQVAVPRNSALVVSRGKGGLLDVVQAPLAAAGVHPRQLEVQQ